MKYLWIFAVLFGFLLFTSPAFGTTASKFAADYGNDLSKGPQIKVLVKVKGELESDDPAKRAKEIRYFQSAVLKFCSFAGAVNVKSHTWNNEFTAEVTTSLAEVIEQRNDVISVQVLKASIQLPPKLQEVAFGRMSYDLVPNVEVEIVDLKIVPMYDKPKDPLDDSDVLVITFEITNKGIDYFVLSDKMFKILVLDPSFPVGKGKPESSYIVDNYFTLYDDELEVRYDDYPNLEVFEDCDYLHDRIFVNQTKTYSICFDVLRKWNNEILNIDGLKHYFLVLMDNSRSNTCPNCIENLLSSEMMSSYHKKILLPSKLQETLDKNDVVNLPFWIQKTINWYNQGMISETELINAINYLNVKSSEEIITQVKKTKLRLNDIPTSGFNGGMPIGFSGNLSTESEFIPNAEILIVGDGPCPANGIISKGLTDKFGRYHIFTELMIWDPSDNMIKIHAEYLGNEIYLPSSSQEEVIVVYPTKDTKSC